MTSIQLTAAYLDRSKALAVPGAFWSKDERAYVLPDPTPRAAAVALKLFPHLAQQHPELPALRAQLGQEIRPFNNAQKFNQAIDAGRVRAALQDEGHDLYKFQAVDLGYLSAILQTHGGAYLGWERGLGKTVGAAALIDELDCERTLIVCPNTAKQSVWAPELARLLPEWMCVVVLRNTAAQRNKDLGYVRQLINAGMRFALVVHYESLAIIGDYWKSMPKWDLIVADEVHRISNPKTKMARALKKIPAYHKLALSGSIIQNHADEMFSPLQWLFPQNYRSKWRDWNDRYLDFVDSGYSRICVGVKIEKLDEMREELGVFMTVRSKADELDLPPRTEETRFVELSPSQRKVYEELRDTCLAQLDDGSIIKATDALALLTKLRQVATGLDLVSGEIADSSKLDYAVDLIRDNPAAAFAVFGWYRASLRALADRLAALGIECYVVDGAVPAPDRARHIAEFQAGQGQVFLGTISTLGESVTLHRASNAIFLDRSWNPAANSQAADRIYRIGQEKPVTVTHIIAKDTVDELRVLPVIREKDDLRRLILGVS